MRKTGMVVSGALGWAIGWGSGAFQMIDVQGELFNYPGGLPEGFFLTWSLKILAFFVLGFLIAGVFSAGALRLAKPAFGIQHAAGLAAIWALGAALAGGAALTLGTLLTRTLSDVRLPQWLGQMNWAIAFPAVAGGLAAGLVGHASLLLFGAQRKD